MPVGTRFGRFQLEWSFRTENGDFHTYEVNAYGWEGDVRLYVFEVRGPGVVVDVKRASVEALLDAARALSPTPLAEPPSGKLDGYWLHWRRDEEFGTLEWRLGELPDDAPAMRWVARATAWAREALADAPDREPRRDAAPTGSPADRDRTIQVFRYIAELDAFELDPTYQAIAWHLGLVDWSPVVWIGRLFAMDEDFGEHWFDNWDEREAIEWRARELGYETERLFVIDPGRFVGGRDGPCHGDEQRRRFWRDVLKSLRLSLETLFAEAHTRRGRGDDPFGDRIADLPARMEAIRRGEFPTTEQQAEFDRLYGARREA